MESNWRQNRWRLGFTYRFEVRDDKFVEARLIARLNQPGVQNYYICGFGSSTEFVLLFTPTGTDVGYFADFRPDTSGTGRFPYGYPVDPDHSP